MDIDGAKVKVRDFTPQVGHIYHRTSRQHWIDSDQVVKNLGEPIRLRRGGLQFQCLN